MRVTPTLILVLGIALAEGHYFQAQSIIDKVNAAGTTWTAGHNFPEKTPVGHIKNLLGALRNGEKLPKKTLESSETIPSEFDARTAWPDCPTISHVSDQGNCGSCWAVAAATAFSDRVCIASNATITAQLSAIQLTSCQCFLFWCSNGCDGGYLTKAWKYLHNTGLVSGGDYGSGKGCQPYSIEPCEHHVNGSRPVCTGTDIADPTCYTKCTNEEYTVTYKSDRHYSGSPYTLESVEDAQRDIMKHGSIEAAFDVYEDFVTYKSGVYAYTTGEYMGSHAVRVIGWGTENDVDYWLVSNSWNTDWGDSGFFKIKRGVDECGIEDDFTAGVPS